MKDPPPPVGLAAKARRAKARRAKARRAETWAAYLGELATRRGRGGLQNGRSLEWRRIGPEK